MSLYTIMVDARGRKSILRGDGKDHPYRWYHAAMDWIHEHTVEAWRLRHWRRRQAYAASRGTRFYGDGGTIHSSGHVDVELHKGRVVASYHSLGKPCLPANRWCESRCRASTDAAHWGQIWSDLECAEQRRMPSVVSEMP